MPADRESGTRAKPLPAAPLRVALLATHTSEEALARRLGCSRALVRKIEHGSAPLSVERVEAIHAASPTVGRELARQMIERLRPLAEDAPVSTRGPAAALRHLTAELGHVAAVLDEALEDEMLTGDEWARVDAELVHVVEAALAMRRARR